MLLRQLLINYNWKVLTSLSSKNIKNYQQHLSFYYSSNKIFLKIVPKGIGWHFSLKKKIIACAKCV